MSNTGTLNKTLWQGTTTIAGGETILTLDSDFHRQLADLGVEVNTVGKAMLSDETDSLRLPITRGEITDESIIDWMGMAEVEHNGSGLGLTRNGMTVELDNWSLNTGTGNIHASPLIRKMGNPPQLMTDMSVFALAASADLSPAIELDADSDEETILLDEADIILTAEGARTLNDLLALNHALREGMMVGTATVRISTG